MKLKEVIGKKLYGTWSFVYNKKAGILSFAPGGINAHIHYGYDEILDAPETIGDYKNLTVLLNQFKIDNSILLELIDLIVCERIRDQ